MVTGGCEKAVNGQLLSKGSKDSVIQCIRNSGDEWQGWRYNIMSVFNATGVSHSVVSDSLQPQGL